MMRFTLFTIILCFSFGCAAKSGTRDDSGKEPKIVSTKVFVNDQCLISEANDTTGANGFGAALAGALIPVVVDYAINFFTKELTEIKKNESVGTGYLDLYLIDDANVKNGSFPQLNSHFRCFTILTGEFDKSSNIPQGYLNKKIKIADSKIKTYDALVVHLANNGLNLVNSGTLYSAYEFNVDLSEDKSAFKLVNKFLLVKKLLENEKKRELIFNVRLLGPGVNESGVEYLSMTQNFGNVVPSDIAKADFGSKKESGYFAIPLLNKASWLAFARDYVTSDYDIAKLANKKYMPAKVVAKNTQIRKPTDADKFIAALLEKAKEPISSAIVSKLSPPDNSQAIYDAKIAVQEAKNTKEKAKEEDDEGAVTLADLKIEKNCELLESLGVSNACP
tara:strand:- start:1678 stop:2850 length:1173 start_codon:yes stop_codon:yes gene_type:complete